MCVSVSLLSLWVPVYKYTIKFITSTSIKTNDQHEHRYRDFSTENCNIRVLILICVVPLDRGTCHFGFHAVCGMYSQEQVRKAANGKMQWSSPRDQGLGLEAPRGQKWQKSLGLGSWSLSLGLEEKVLQFFKTFDVILDGSKQGTPWHFAREQKQFAIRKRLFERTFCTQYTSASVERVFNNGAIC